MPVAATSHGAAGSYTGVCGASLVGCAVAFRARPTDTTTVGSGLAGDGLGVRVVVRRVVGSGASSQGKGSAGDDRSRACSSVFAGPACCIVISAGQTFYEQRAQQRASSGRSWQQRPPSFLKVKGIVSVGDSSPPVAEWWRGSGRMRGGPGRMRGGPGRMRGGSGRMRGGPARMRGGSGRMRGGPGRMRGGSGRMRRGPGRMRGGSGRMRGGPGRMRGGPGRMRGGSGRMRGGPGRMRGGPGGIRGGLGRIGEDRGGCGEDRGGCGEDR